MSKKLLVVLFVFTSAFAAMAQDTPNPTVELLRAQPAEHFVRIGLVPKGDTYELQYGIDTFDNLDPLTAGVVLRTDDGAEIYLAWFNPLTQNVIDEFDGRGLSFARAQDLAVQQEHAPRSRGPFHRGGCS